MTEAIRQKASARRALAILIGLLVTILALQGIASVKPGGFEAFAQATASPTPSGPRIELLNPDVTTSDEISSKNDNSGGGTGTTYHLVAWVTQVPQNALVEFQFQATGSNRADVIPCAETTGGVARFVSPDTFECDFNVTTAFPEAGGATAPGGDAPANGTIRAILFGQNAQGQNAELSRDEEPVAINNQDRPAATPPDFRIENQGNTVEISYPVNGGQVGFFTPPGTNVAAGAIDVFASQGTRNVRVFFSRSAPGTEPAFQSCGRRAVADNEPRPVVVRCTLPAGVGSSAVTAIAASAEDFNEDPVGTQQETTNVDAADAHRAFGYEQDPTSVFITPQTQRVDANPQGQFTACAPLMTARVFDQQTQQRPVVGVNVDVSAEGPTDALSFDDDDAAGNSTSRSQAPDQGGHSTESAANCEATGTPGASGSQGEHERAGQGDRKHIESQAEGTNRLGEFTFRLFSPNTGATQITAWADEDGNDVYCSEEAAGIASIGWGQDAPSPTGVSPEQTTCPRPTPGQTGSPTVTATATATSTTTATPTGTNTTTGGATTGRTVTLAADKNEMPAGRTVTFSGQVLSNDRTCTDNEFVQIRRRILGTTSFRDLFATRTDSQGGFRIETRARKSADYIAVVTQQNNCQQDTSDEVTVLVKVLIQILPSDKNPDRGDTIRFKSSVRPEHDRTTLLLQRKKGRRWVTVDRDKLNKDSIGNFTVRANFGSRTFRTKWKSQDAEHESNTSREVTIRTG